MGVCEKGSRVTEPDSDPIFSTRRSLDVGQVHCLSLSLTFLICKKEMIVVLGIAYKEEGWRRKIQGSWRGEHGVGVSALVILIS